VTDVDWALLRRAATSVMQRAYAPYSQFPVGAAGLVEDGRVVTGCNVENASYGLGICAEVSLVAQLVSTGGGRLVAVSVVDSQGELLAPCGRCRQVLIEFGGAQMVLDRPGGVRTLGELLPEAFTPHDLEGDRP
jgi:cytidine deaminase